MWINYGCDVIKEVKVWWHQTIITCPLRHRVSLKKYNVTCYETQIHVIDSIIAFLIGSSSWPKHLALSDLWYYNSLFIWSSSWPKHLALSDLSMVKKYYICLSAYNASICLWLYWKLFRSNFFIWIHRNFKNIYWIFENFKMY